MTNKLKHLATALLAFGLSSSTLSAQGTETNEDKFPHIFIGGAGGGFFQLNQKGYDVKNIFTPAGAFNLGAMFNPYVGMRFQYAGWKEKGHTTRLTSNRKYKYGFHTPGLDALVDVTNIFYGKKQHVFHAYAIGGIGFSAGRGHQTDVNDVYLSGQSRFTVDYRAGLQLEARINHLLGVYVEGLAINMHDHNRPELGKAGEWRIQTMIGLNFHLGGKNRVAKPATYTAPVTAENQTVTPQQPTTPPVQKAEPKPEPKPQPAPAPVLENRRAEVFFTIGKAEISADQEKQVAAFAQWLKNHPKARVISITGYADAGTGTAAINRRVSQKRAQAVAKMLINKYGISADRIDQNAVGDTVQPFSENDRNRVVIALAEEK